MPPRAVSAARAANEAALAQRKKDEDAARARMEEHLAQFIARQFLDMRVLPRDMEADALTAHIKKHEEEVVRHAEVAKIAKNVFAEAGLNIPVQGFVRLLAEFCDLRVELSSQLFRLDDDEKAIADVAPLDLRKRLLFPRVTARVAVVTQVLEMTNSQMKHAHDPHKFADLFRKNLSENGLHGGDMIGFYQALEDAVEFMLTVRMQVARLTGVPLNKETIHERLEFYTKKLNEQEERVKKLGEALDQSVCEGGAAAAAAAAAAEAASSVPAPDSAAASAATEPVPPATEIRIDAPSPAPSATEELRQRAAPAEPSGDQPSSAAEEA